MTRCSRRARERGLFRPDYVRRLLDEHCGFTRDHHTRLWALLMLELWFQMWIDAPAEAAICVPQPGMSRDGLELPSTGRRIRAGRITECEDVAPAGPSSRLNAVIGSENPSELTQRLLVTLVRDLRKVTGELQAHPLARADRTSLPAPIRRKNS